MPTYSCFSPRFNTTQVVFDLRVDVQVGVIGATGVLIVVDHPVDVAVDQQVGAAQGDAVGESRGDLPGACAGAWPFGVAAVEVQREIVEPRHGKVKSRADQVGFAVPFAVLVSHGQQHILDRAELEFLIEDFAERQAWAEFAVVGVRAFVTVWLAVVEDAVDKQEVVAVLPFVGMFKGDGLLDRKIGRASCREIV